MWFVVEGGGGQMTHYDLYDSLLFCHFPALHVFREPCVSIFQAALGKIEILKTSDNYGCNFLRVH